jgi:hypothetical protein
MDYNTRLVKESEVLTFEVINPLIKYDVYGNEMKSYIKAEYFSSKELDPYLGYPPEYEKGLILGASSWRVRMSHEQADHWIMQLVFEHDFEEVEFSKIVKPTVKTYPSTKFLAKSGYHTAPAHVHWAKMGEVIDEDGHIWHDHMPDVMHYSVADTKLTSELLKNLMYTKKSDS